MAHKHCSILILGLLSACATINGGSGRDLAYKDLNEDEATLLGRQVSIVGATERRLDGRPELDIWLSAAARAHAFGLVRGNYCVLAEDSTGRLQALKQGSIVRIKGTVRSDPSVTALSMECPSTLIVSVASFEVIRRRNDARVNVRFWPVSPQKPVVAKPPGLAARFTRLQSSGTQWTKVQSAQRLAPPFP